MITGDIKAIKKMALTKLKASKNPFELMANASLLLSQIGEEDEGFTKAFMTDTAKILDEDIKGVTDMDELHDFLLTIHNGYVIASAMVLMEK